eukprot:PhF_6_TR10587/c0_g1_i1/m.16952
MSTFDTRWNIATKMLPDLSRTLTTSRTTIPCCDVHVYTTNQMCVWLRRDRVNLDDDEEDHHITVVQMLHGPTSIGTVTRMPFKNVFLPDELDAIPKLCVGPEGGAFFIFGVPRCKKHTVLLSLLEEIGKVLEYDGEYRLAMVQYQPKELYDLIHNETLPHPRAPNLGVPDACFADNVTQKTYQALLRDVISNNSSMMMTAVCHFFMYMYSPRSGRVFSVTLLTTHPSLVKSFSAFLSVLYGGAIEDKVCHCRHTFTTLLSPVMHFVIPRHFIIGIDPKRRRDTVRMLSSLEENLHVTPLEYPLKIYVTARIVHYMKSWARACREVTIYVTKEPEKLVYVDMPITFVVSLCFRSKVTARNNSRSNDAIIINDMAQYQLHYGCCEVVFKPITVTGSHSLSIRWKDVLIHTRTFVVASRPPSSVAIPKITISHEPPETVEVNEYFDFTVAVPNSENRRIDIVCYGPPAAIEGPSCGLITNGVCSFTYKIGTVGMFQLAVRFNDIRQPPTYTRPVVVKTTPVPVLIDMVVNPSISAIYHLVPVTISISLSLSETIPQYVGGTFSKGSFDVYLCDVYNGMTSLGKSLLSEGKGTLSNIKLNQSNNREVFLKVLCAGEAINCNGESVPFRCTHMSQKFIVGFMSNELELRILQRPLRSVPIGHTFDVHLEIRGNPALIPLTCVAYARIESARVSFRVQGGFVNVQLVNGKGILTGLLIPCLGKFDIGLRVPLQNGLSLQATVTKVECSDNPELLEMQLEEELLRLDMQADQHFENFELDTLAATFDLEIQQVIVLEEIGRLMLLRESAQALPNIVAAFEHLQDCTLQYFNERKLTTNCQLDVTLQPNVQIAINAYFSIVVVLMHRERKDVLTFASGVADISLSNPLPGLSLQQMVGGNARVPFENGTAAFSICVRVLGRMQLLLKIYPRNCEPSAIPLTVLTTPFEIIPPPRQHTYTAEIESPVSSHSRTRLRLSTALTATTLPTRMAQAIARRRSLNPAAELRPTSIDEEDMRRFTPKFPKGTIFLMRSFTFSVEVLQSMTNQIAEEAGVGRLQLLRIQSEGLALENGALIAPSTAANLEEGFVTWHNLVILRPGIFSFRIEYQLPKKSLLSHAKPTTLIHVTDPFHVKFPTPSLVIDSEVVHEMYQNDTLSVVIHVQLDGNVPDYPLTGSILSIHEVSLDNGVVFVRVDMSSVIEGKRMYDICATESYFIVQISLIMTGTFRIRFHANIAKIGECHVYHEVTVVPIARHHHHDTHMHSDTRNVDSIYERLAIQEIHHPRKQVALGKDMRSGFHPSAREKKSTPGRVALYPVPLPIRNVGLWLHQPSSSSTSTTITSQTASRASSPAPGGNISGKDSGKVKKTSSNDVSVTFM